MTLLTLLCALVCITLATTTFAATQKRGYVLTDTTSLPPPADGTARLVDARDMTNISENLKPEFVLLDRTPVGLLPQRAAVTMEVPAGWHRVWLGRGASSPGVYMEFVPDGRYLLRLRESVEGGTWRGDLVRENGSGYISFAKSRDMQLAIMDKKGRDALQRNIDKLTPDVWAKDSTARLDAIAKAKLPIVIKEAWYLPIANEDAPAGDWDNHPGTLTVDERSLRFARGDSVVVEIPRDSIQDVYFGSQRGGSENPWIKLGYTTAAGDQGVRFADASPSTATESYNRLFAELSKPRASH